MASILIGGGSGMIGARLSALLTQAGHHVLHLSRRRRPNASYPTYQWDAAAGHIEEEAVRKADYVINLAGAGIADQRWTDRRKQVIIDSRVGTTGLLRRAFEQYDSRPRAFLSSAGIGIYGDRGDEQLTEEAPPGEGFLPESCLAWESAAHEVAQDGIRTVIFRQGIVLSTTGGALPRIGAPVDFFIAPFFGNGQHWYSWIHIDDACRCFIRAIEDESMAGTYNVVAPNSIRNIDFMRQVVKAKRKPALLAPVPAFGLRLVFGEMAHTILDSNRVIPQRLEAADFHFEFPELLPALRDLYERRV